jgi:hypothetical protein
MKKLLLVLGIVITTMTSCAIFQSAQHRAQNHLKKAISLDPSILRDSVKITTIDSVRIKDSINIITKDSTITRLKDSTIIHPGGSLTGTINNPCDSITGLQKFDYNLGSGTHRLRVWSDGTHVFFNSTTDSLVSVIQSRDTYTSHIKDSFSTKEAEYKKEIDKLQKQVVTKVIYKARWYQFILPVLFALVIGYFVRRFKLL